jgi:hypothetical protein
VTDVNALSILAEQLDRARAELQREREQSDWWKRTACTAKQQAADAAADLAALRLRHDDLAKQVTALKRRNGAA